MKKWFVVIILACAQFVMILDSTVMNVSISTVAKDLGTTISGMQAAITFYALTMAAFMLTGGKLGDVWGRRKAFKIGAVIYGVGSLTTALAPSLGVLLVGWSLVEGLGAILIIPAIAALTAANYHGRDRLVAFSIIGTVTGLAAAAGPIIGGFITTYLDWRYVFAAETLIMVVILLLANKISDEKPDHKPKLDFPSVGLSAVGMGTLVFGVLQTKDWGWVNPLTPDAPAIFGVSLSAYLILAGIGISWWFISRQRRLEAAGVDPLLKVSMLKIPELRGGLSVLMSQYFTIAALFFVVPVYLQTILGLDAIQTGIKLLPLSAGLILFSIVGSRLAATVPARRIVRFGQVGLAAGSLFVLSAVDPQLASVMFWIGMFIVGCGFGLLASQIGNINMSAVSKTDSAEVGGLQGTFQNLGNSFGTALVGSIFMLALTSGFTNSVQESSGLTPTAKSMIALQAEKGIQIVSPGQVQKAVVQTGGTQQTADTVSQLYEDAQLKALRLALFVVFLFALAGLVFSRHLPATAKLRSP